MGGYGEKTLGGPKEKVFGQVRCYFTKYINAKEHCQRAQNLLHLLLILNTVN